MRKTYKVRKDSGLIYSFISHNVSEGFFTQCEGKLTKGVGDPFTWNRMSAFRPISQQTVKFFMKDGGYNTEYFRTE